MLSVVASYGVLLIVSKEVAVNAFFTVAGAVTVRSVL